MSLESILKPFEFIDEQILRQYTKLTNHLESNGHDKYDIAFNANLALSAYQTFDCIIANINHKVPKLEFSQIPIYDLGVGITIGLTTGFLELHDFFYSLYKKDNKHLNHFNSEKAISYFDYISQKIQKATRLPLLSYSLYHFYDFGESLISNGLDFKDWDYISLQLGAYALTTASSMYLKGSDPKVLEKEPFWKKSIDWVKERYQQMLPNPIPSPQIVSISYKSTN